MSATAEPAPIPVPSAFLHPKRMSRQRQKLTQLFIAEKTYFLRIATAVLRNPTDAEDAVHTGFCSAWKSVESFRGESSMKTWLTRIVHNSALTMLRRARLGRTVSLEDDPGYLHTFELRLSAAVEDPEGIATRKERVRIVRRHLHFLPDETRAIFRLHFEEDYTIDTIARLRRKSRPSVAAHLQRGKAILRKRMLQATRRSGPTVSPLVH